MNKKGQFFLIAAVVIAGIILTMSTINISTKPSQKEQTSLYDLSKEIDYESSQLIDYGVYSRSEGETKNQIGSFISNYSAANPDTDILFIYGNQQSLTALTVLLYNRTATGNVDISGAGLEQYQTATVIPNYVVTGNEVVVELGEGQTLNFVLQPGENFFIVMKKQIGGETIVAKQ